MKDSKKAATLEYEKENSAEHFQDLTDQIATTSKILEQYQLLCEKELTQRDNLYQKRMKLQDLLRHFENNNEGYLKSNRQLNKKWDSVL